jgi:hypothetical protein
VGPAPRPAATRNTSTAFVHIDAGPGVELRGWNPDARIWWHACRAPCDTELPFDADYRLDAGDGRPSLRFTLGASSGQRVDIAIIPGSKAAMIGGGGLVVVGALMMAGGIVLVFYSFGDQLAGCGAGTCGVGEAGGAALLVAGGGALVGGVLLMRFRGHTRQTQTVSDFLLPKVQERPDTAWLRSPVWRDSAKAGVTGSPRVGIPLFSRTF